VLVRGVPGHPRDIGAADADVGKLAVAQARQFAQALIVTLPFLDEADECGKHDSPLSLKSGPWPLNLIIGKIVIWRRLKSDYAALQLSEKRIAQETDY
jgi:hypothetical protein